MEPARTAKPWALLTAIRVLRRMSLRTVATGIGQRATSLALIEAGARTPNPATLTKLADALHVPHWVLVTRELGTDATPNTLTAVAEVLGVPTTVLADAIAQAENGNDLEVEAA